MDIPLGAQGQQAYLMLLGMVTLMPEARQKNITDLKNKIQDIVEVAGDDGIIAVTLAGMEVALDK